MLALVTCHIFPPSIWYGKKWIPGTWLPGWQLAVFQSPQLHECGPADAHGNAQPFCMDKCIFRKKRLFCNLATRWNKILQFVPSFPIYGWLTWWCDFFPVGSAFEDHPQEFGQKKVQPLGLYFWYLRLGLFKSPFFGWWSWRYVVVPFFARTNAFSAKNICVVICARVDTKFLNSSHHVLSVDDWPGDATFFLWGQPLKIIRKYSVKKGPAPWILFLTRAPRPLEVTFFGSWSWTYVVVPLLQGQMSFQKKKRLFCNLGALTQNSWIRPIMSYLWMIGLVMRFFSCGVSLWRLSRKYSVKKRSSPLDFIFDTCASASSSHFFGWWSWTCVSVPFCKDNCIFSKKNMCFANWARVDTKFLNSSRHVLSVDDWPGDATFFLWGQPLKIIRKYSVKKGPAPWILFLTPAPWPLEVTFFGWWRWTYVFVPFCKVM